MNFLFVKFAIIIHLLPEIVYNGFGISDVFADRQKFGRALAS